MSATRVDIEYPADAPFQDFYCPACGTPILKANETRGESVCEHVDFLFIEELGEFRHIRPEFRERIRAAGISLVGIGRDDADEFTGTLAKLATSNTAVFFYVTTVGMSCCRSIAVTVVIGMDLYRPAGR